MKKEKKVTEGPNPAEKKIVRRQLIWCIDKHIIDVTGDIDDTIRRLESLKSETREAAENEGYILVNDTFYIKGNWPGIEYDLHVYADTYETDKEMEIRLKKSEAAKKSAAKRSEAKAKRELKELERLKKKYESGGVIQ